MNTYEGLEKLFVDVAKTAMNHPVETKDDYERRYKDEHSFEKRARDFIFWCGGMAGCHGGDYMRVYQEVRIRFPEFVQELEARMKFCVPI
jgi:hypothetical protein